jgi:hypothetical protein
MEDVPFETIFTAYPWLSVSLMSGAISCFLFVSMMNFFIRAKQLNVLIHDEINITDKPEADVNKKEQVRNEPEIIYMLLEKKRCLYRTAISGFFLIAVLIFFAVFMNDSGTVKDLWIFVCAFGLLLCCYNLIKTVRNHLEDKKVNSALKENISDEFYTSTFKNLIFRESAFSLVSVAFDVFCICMFTWALFYKLL